MSIDAFDDERIRVWPRTISEVFSSLHRAGYRVLLIHPAEAMPKIKPPEAVLK